MPLTPAEIIHWQFRRRLFGYSVKDVKAFVQQVSETVAQLMEENQALKEERERLLERLQVYQAIEQQLQNALVVAEKTADDIKRQAQREAELIIAQAQREAEQIKADAHSQYQAQLEKIERLRQLQMRLITELRHLLLSYLELLEKAEAKVGGEETKLDEEPMD
ncbi:DivIVA domain-containing protein [Fervidibacter sacchari]|uniref:Cell division initiation protein n=1 Tax=Candidatus Fervidibacter sacchari TaxID=1448929 RepID=A0ABT2ET08_9BACT|nr:DivIVA domain-containing protein [Candidatus Fervidibacter sacchari]MCS3920985.1 cell division initiation protein [Candidatus Fervidibacter sacchari]WKU14927.1 DivIVA domain-containing protein [Candidatus Fervidibacter sacchari]